MKATRFVALLLSACLLLGCAHRPTVKSTVPSGFKYPELGEQVLLPDTLVVSAVAGRVLDPNGDPVKRALVEVMTAHWEGRIAATFTDDSGHFALPHLKSGEYPVKVTKPGFAPLLAKVRVSETATQKLEFVMHLGT